MDVSTGKHGCLGKIHSISEKANTSYQHKYLLPDSSEEEKEEKKEEKVEGFYRPPA